MDQSAPKRALPSMERIATVGGGLYDLARMGIAGLLLVAGAVLLTVHAVLWLWHGVWPSEPLVNHLCGSGFDTWCQMPTSWLGVHKVVSWLPLWLSCWIAAGLVAALPKGGLD